MFYKLFNRLIERTPYTLSIAIPNIIWSMMVAMFGFILIVVRADFEATGTWDFFITSFSMAVLLAAFLIILEFGLLDILGLQKYGRKETRTLNENIKKGHVRSDISKKDISQLNDSLNKVHKKLLFKNLQYTSMVVIIVALVEWFMGGTAKNIPIILAGGSISVALSFICAAPFYEILFFPVRRECKIILARQRVSFEEQTFSSLKSKSRLFIALTAIALGIVLVLLPYLAPILIIFFAITLLITSILSGMIFESIYKSFMEIKEAAKELERGNKASFYSGSVDKEIVDLTKSLNAAANEMYDVKNILEVQVRARTKALEEEKKGLEKKVEKRTEELRERIEELERFHNITVKRELKMIELKGEIKKLKEGAKRDEK